MVYGDTSLKETNDIEQKTVISRMHSMQWLKSNSQLFGHSKAFPHGNDSQTELVKNDIDQAVDGSTQILPSTSLAENTNIKQSDISVSKDNTEKVDSATGRGIELSQSASDIENTMETVWNKDAPSTLFPDTQSLVLQRLDEEEMMSFALAESMVTAQLEQFRIDDNPDDSSETACGKTNNDTWDSAQKKSDTINTISNQENSKQCHDSNNNNAKSEIISEISKDVIKKHNWADDEGDDIDQSCAAVESSSEKKDNSHDTYENASTNRGLDSSKIFLAESSKSKKVEGIKSRQSITGKSHISLSSNNAVSKSKTSVDEKQNEADNSRRCHKVQVTRTQSHNDQYIRNKGLARPQPRYSRTITKSDQDLSKKPPISGPSTNPGTSNSMDNRQRYNSSRFPPSRDGYHRRYDQEDPKRQETGPNSNYRSTSGPQLTSGLAPMRNTSRTFEGSNSNRFDRSSTQTLNRMSQSTSSGRPLLSNPKNFNDRYDRDNTSNGQRLKRDSNVYRRSSDYSSSRYQNVKPKVDDHRRVGSGGNNVGRDDREDNKDLPLNPTHSNTTRMTETSLQNIGSSENVQHVASYKEEEQIHDSMNSVQTGTSHPTKSNIKTGQEQEINSSHNKASPGETKTVKFSDNVQEINIASHSVPPYPSNPAHPNKPSTNPFIDESQLIGQMNMMQPLECVQSMPREQFYDNTMSYAHVSPISIHNSEHQEAQLQKDGQMLQTPSPTCMPHMPLTTSGVMPYSNHPGLYLNQYNPVHNILRKSPEGTNMPQNSSSPNNTMQNAGTQNMMPTDSSSVMMHGNQQGVVPPPGFQNHPQQEQWTFPHPEMVYYGNMMNPVHSVGMPMQNMRPPCGGGDYNALQQTGYLQQPLYYMPPICMQSWNPVMQCPAQLLQNAQYPGYNPLGHQVLPSGNLMEPMSCPVSTTGQNHPYKNYRQGEGDYRKDLSPGKMDACMNLQAPVSKQGNTKVKENAFDAQRRASQYYKAPNEYQNTSHDTQAMSPYTYSTPIVVPSMKPYPSNTHSQIYQKYPVPRNVASTNYSRISDPPHFNNWDYGRKEEMSKNDLDCIPPMVSPRECMYYGINYSRKTDYTSSPTLKSEMKH